MIRTNLIDLKELQVNITSLPELSVPASISALRLQGSPHLIRQFAWENYAIELIQAAVIWLISTKRVRLLKALIGRSILSLRIGTQTTYLLSEGAGTAAPGDGRLEQEILHSIALTDCRSISDTRFPGAFIDKVVGSLIGSFQLHPSHRVVHAVQLDAQRRGWGTSYGLASPQFRPAPDRLEELVREQQNTKSMVETFKADYPGIHRALTAQIRKGLRSRLEIYVWDSA